MTSFYTFVAGIAVGLLLGYLHGLDVERGR